LRRRLNLSPAANRSFIKMLQADFLRAGHALVVMQSLGHFAPALRKKKAPAEAGAVLEANCSGSYAWQSRLGIVISSPSPISLRFWSVRCSPNRAGRATVHQLLVRLRIWARRFPRPGDFLLGS
jgi:hypothetical protein